MPPAQGGSPADTPPTLFPTERELIVVVKPEARISTSARGVESLAGTDLTDLLDATADEDVTLLPLFGTEERLRQRMEHTPADVDEPDLSVFYQVVAPDDRLDELADRLAASEVVESAYVKPGAEPPLRYDDEDVAPVEDAPPGHTPDFVGRQGYLDAAPGGVDARYAWTVPGGRGSGVRIIDIEGAWRFTHEDLRQNQGGVAGGTESADLAWRNHGTAVVGEFSGDVNTFGITGICLDANVRAVSIFGTGMGSARAITTAADLLGPGDVIIIELHRPGPQFDFAPRTDQRGYIAIEWWEDDFQAVRYAANRGVVVVAAAGNGAENLDDVIYETRPAGFPTTWTNPFNRGNRDSGAIIVGAGAPPSGTHGRDHGPDRSRLDFSNWGSVVDAQGWGREVTTTGGRADQAGDLQGGADEDEWYTDRFSGTSSATPIVTGVLGSVQGALRAHGRIPLSPARARAELRATGSAQQDAPNRPATQRIGTRPNLRQLVPRALQAAGVWVGTQFTGTLGPNQTTCWFTFNWPAHWHVVWTVVPVTPRAGAPQIRWRTRVERASDSRITYWICITNLTGESITVEGRYAVLGW